MKTLLPHFTDALSMDNLFLNPDDWLGQHNAVCLILIGALVLAVEWIAPLI